MKNRWCRTSFRSSALELASMKTYLFTDIHIHVPSGAIPKMDLIGVTMLTALVSLLTDIKVDPHLAMTGEATLRGAVLLLEVSKKTAAHRVEYQSILPEKTERPSGYSQGNSRRP